MSGGFSNKPKILRGAFVEYGLSIPPLIVPFQFNPVQLSRNRSISFGPPNDTASSSFDSEEEWSEREENKRSTGPSLREFHQQHKDLFHIRDHQKVTLNEESISFEIRLDATDKLDEGDFIAQQFGIAPQLAALEMMVYPKEESLLGAALGSLLGGKKGFSFTKGENPPLVLFIWGRKRVLPVNITSMNVKETEFSTDLNPLRATVSVSLTVIEGSNPPYKYSKIMKEAMSVLNLANITDIANVMIPG
jgi:hypothetical protein